MYLSVAFICGLVAAISVQPGSTTTYTYEIVDTDVNEFYDSSAEIDAPAEGEAFYGQDATYAYNHHRRQHYTWDEVDSAAESCSTGGYSDCRVPTIKELYSLIQFSGDVSGETAGTKLFIDTDYFEQPLGDTSAGYREIDAQVWSGTQYDGYVFGDTECAFGVNFVDGRIKCYALQRGPGYVERYWRFVRGNTDYGVNNFVRNGDGTISDSATGLMWTKSDSGASYDWENALAYCEDLKFAGYTDWKLPNAKELQSLVRYS